MSKTVRALIVYESMFGNTERIARAIAEGLQKSVPAEIVPVYQAPAVLPDDVRLLVVGGPTHALSMSRMSTRQEAWKQQEVVMPIEVGVREWLAALSGPAKGRRSQQISAATFDTRIAKVRRLSGSAARSAARVLRRMGYRVEMSESYFVDDTTGPIRDGEIERARQWGEELGRSLTGPAKVA
jgi:flavodoxin